MRRRPGHGLGRAENPDTGSGGHVWIGALTTGAVFQLDGETGAILAQTRVGNPPMDGPYGGAMDRDGNFWIVLSMCTTSPCRIVRVDTETLEATTLSVPCGYGITVDSQGRVWTSGHYIDPRNPFNMGSCVNRHDPATGEDVTYISRGVNEFYRGLAVDGNGSVWVADTGGDVLQMREEDVSLVNRFHAGPSAVVGIAVDYQDQIWAVSQGGNAALRIDPETYVVESFPVGRGPYTYSDMTGYQLRAVMY